MNCTTIVRAFFMRKISEYAFLWGLGGCLYYSFELLFRGFSHWTMFLLGGISLLFCTIQGQILRWEDPLWIQILRCTVFVVSLEFITGIIVNKWMGLAIWDYTGLPLQLFGQICLPFAVIFSGLCAFAILAGGYLACWLFQDIRPRLHFL